MNDDFDFSDHITPRRQQRDQNYRVVETTAGSGFVFGFGWVFGALLAMVVIIIAISVVSFGIAYSIKDRQPEQPAVRSYR